MRRGSQALTGDASKGRKALMHRGWNPLNRALLTKEAVLKTKPKDVSVADLPTINTETRQKRQF